MHSICLPEGLTVEDTFDYDLANYSIGSLQLAKQMGVPFFIMVGFRRPHLPWRLPRQFWDMYVP